MATPTTLPSTFVAGNVLTAAEMNALRGAFRILQVVSTTKTDTWSASIASGGDSQVTGLTASITPSSASSKVLVIANVTTSTGPDRTGISLDRDGTRLNEGDAASNRSQTTAAASSTVGSGTLNINAVYLDSPSSTSSLTYSVYVVCLDSVSATYYVNRSTTDSDSSSYPRSASTITLMEVSA